MTGRRRAPTYDELVTSCQVAVDELEHAAAALRALVPAQPIVFRLQLGPMLINLASVVYTLGDSERAQQLIEEGVETVRAAVALDARHLRTLARCESSLASFLAGMAQHERAADQARAAAGTWRRVVEKDPKHVTDLAGTLPQLAESEKAIGAPERSLTTAQDALTALQEAGHHGHLEPGAAILVQAQKTVAERLEALGRCQEAVALIDAAIDEKRSLEHTPEVSEMVAALLGTQVTMLNALDRYDDAASAGYKSVVVFRSLVRDAGDTATACRHEANLARALTNYTSAAMKVGDGRVALEASDEAVSILRAQVPANPDEIEPDLLKALWAFVNARGVALITIEEAHDGLRALLEVARLASRLATRDSAQFGGDVWRAKKHAADLLSVLDSMPPMRSVIESPEASALRQWAGASGSPLDGAAR